MTTEQTKRVSDSLTEHVQILMQQDINGYNRLFGGRLMEWIDIVAAVVARRHCNREVTTVYVDALKFEAPAYVNDTVLLTGRIVYVGNTSMEVCVDVFVEDLSGARRHINTAYLVLVAIDTAGTPVRVPRLKPETQAERADWAKGETRNALRKARRTEQY